GADLWRDGRRFWLYSGPPNETLYREDAIVTRLRGEPKPFRVLDLNVYPENVLMAHGIQQVLGYQGNELRYYDELLGGRPGTQNGGRYLLTSTKLWDLLAVRFLLISDTVRVPGYHKVLGPVETAAGSRGTAWEAGKITVALQPPAHDSSYLLIAENWYLDWRVTVDGKPGRVLRGDHALLTIPVAPGARRLELRYDSRSFARGKRIALVTLLLVIASFIVPPAWPRVRSGALTRSCCLVRVLRWIG